MISTPRISISWILSARRPRAGGTILPECQMDDRSRPSSPCTYEPGRAADHEVTVMRMTDTTGSAGRSGAVPEQLGLELLHPDSHSAIGPATRPTTRSSRTSTTAIRTTTTWTTSIWSAPSAESCRQDPHVDFPLELLVRLNRAWRRCKRTKTNTPCALRFEMLEKVGSKDYVDRRWIERPRM